MKNIKTLFVCLFVITLLQSCSKDDDNSLNSNKINPPSWIIGSWLDKTEPEWAQIGGFKFTKDNLIELSAENKEILNYNTSLSGLMDVTQTNTTNSYSLKIETFGTTVIEYYFEKGGNNTIIYKLSTVHNVVLTKQ
jgi:hypothetical protein